MLPPQMPSNSFANSLLILVVGPSFQKQQVLVNKMLERDSRALDYVSSSVSSDHSWFVFLLLPCLCHIQGAPSLTLSLLISHLHCKFAGDLDHGLQEISVDTANKLEYCGDHSWATNQSSLPVHTPVLCSDIIGHT